MENKRQSATRPKIGRKTHLLALNSHPTRSGELSKEKIGREAHLLATNSHLARHGELARKKIGRSTGLLAMLGRRARAVKTPHDDVAQTQWGRNLNSPWRAEELARRVDADEKAYK